MNIFERLGRLDRRWVFLMLAIVVVVTLIFPFKTPIRVNPEVKSIYDFVNSVKPGQYIHLAIDYDPNALAELHPMAYAIMEHILSRNIKIIMTSLSQNGPGMAEALMLNVMDSVKIHEHKEVKYGRDIVFLGYKPYYAIVILGMGQNYRLPYPTDYYNTPLDSIPMMENVQNYDQVQGVICISGSNVVDAWITNANGRYNVKLAIGVTGVMAADYYPYLRSGQIFGLMGGMLGAAEYETLAHNLGPAREAMRVQVWAHMVIILFIVMGNIGYFLSRRQRKGGLSA
jgi:preprotein translocase subunit YajC